MGKIYGYARVSTVNQNEDRQLAALLNKGVDEKKIFLINSRVAILTARSTIAC